MIVPGSANAGLLVIQSPRLLDAISNTVGASNLQLCIDAADAESYSGTGQTVSNLAPGTVVDAYLGSTTSSDSADPAFIGTAGSLDADTYFKHESGDYIRMVSTPAWVNALHKTGAKWTAVFLGQLADVSTSANTLFGTFSSSSDAGIIIQILNGSNAGVPNLLVARGTNGSFAKNSSTSSVKFANSVNSFFAVSVDEAGGAGASLFHLNGTSVSFNGAYSSPSASGASDALHIGADGAGVNGMYSGARTYGAAFFDTNLSGNQLASLYAALEATLRV